MDRAFFRMARRDKTGFLADPEGKEAGENQKFTVVRRARISRPCREVNFHDSGNYFFSCHELVTREIAMDTNSRPQGQVGSSEEDGSTACAIKALGKVRSGQEQERGRLESLYKPKKSTDPRPSQEIKEVRCDHHIVLIRTTINQSAAWR
jgi:hypothetical protein